jgi:hypothetical protein
VLEVVNAKIRGLYGLFWERLKELKKHENPKSKIIRFPEVYEKLCSNFSMPKDLAKEILYIFRDFGLIEVVAYQGIKLKK